MGVRAELLEWVCPFQCRRKQNKKAHRESLLNGLLARHTGFEPVALRLGELQLRMALKARRRLDKTQKASN